VARVSLRHRPARRARRFPFAAKVAVAALVGLICALSTTYSLSLAPPGLHARQQTIAAAGLHVLLADQQMPFDSPKVSGGDILTMTKRAALFANIMVSDPTIDDMARRLGIPPSRIGAVSRLTGGAPAAMLDPDLERHASEVIASRKDFRIDVQPDPILPVINVYANAPSPDGAVALATAAVDALQDELSVWSAHHQPNDHGRLVLRHLGEPRGAIVNGKTRPQVMLLTFVLAFALALAAMAAAPSVRRGWRAARADEDGEPRTAAPPRLPTAGIKRHWPERARAGAVRVADDWPRTSRPLPWLIAAFIAMLWLVPFNVIQLNVNAPIDLKLDRLVLPVVFMVWVLALAIGGRRAPRVKLTPIHLGVAGFVAVACFSVVHDAGYLNHTLEFQLAVKKVTLLLSYALFFMLVASVVRPTEVSAYLKYVLWLSVVCAIGTIWQYRFHYDVFYDLAQKGLPGIFSVGQPANGVDDLGRYMTQGPAEHPLEAVAMMSMALPIALVGIIRNEDARKRIWYGLAACILLGAAISTYRKSALLAPVSIILTLAYYQRGQLLRLAPLAAVSFVVVHLISPGALGSVLFQFQPNRLGVSTVSDRTSDYDAVRPDVWSHLPFGLGYGSYDHTMYRVLDSEILNRVVDVGVIGLIAFALMVLSIVVTANRPIRARDARWAPVGLAVGPAAIAYFVLCFLFDVDSFPHTPYILMSLAGLLAVQANDIRGGAHPRRLAPARAAARPRGDDHARRDRVLVSVESGEHR
jgi:hypothetical protein